MRTGGHLFLSSLLMTVIFLINGEAVSGTRYGSPCAYSEIKGRATITAISPSPPEAYNCRNPVQVKFKFVPDDISDRDGYRFPDRSDAEQLLTVGSGMNPSIEWIEEKQIAVGNVYRCIRREITGGTCTPVIFVFSGIDFAGWEKTCF